MLGARDARGLAGRPIQIDHAQTRSRTLLVQQHLERIHAPGTHLATHRSDSLLLAVVGLLNVGPLRPGVARRALIGRSRQELKLAHAARALAHGSTHAIVTGIATANDHNVQAARVHRGLAAIEHRDGRSSQVVHRVHHARGNELGGLAEQALDDSQAIEPLADQVYDLISQGKRYDIAELASYLSRGK